MLAIIMTPLLDRTAKQMGFPYRYQNCYQAGGYTNRHEVEPSQTSPNSE